jgi:REP element-mobilizing transposase RayT
VALPRHSFLWFFSKSRLPKNPSMDAGRKPLPHHPPLWLDIRGAIFFITCCAQGRAIKPFAAPFTAAALLESIHHQIDSRTWLVHAATIMPDHVHLVLEFPQEADVAKSVCDWKRWTARTLGFRWQRDFFEHRLRHDESFDAKTRYVLENPVRAGFVQDWRDWPYTISSKG